MTDLEKILIDKVNISNQEEKIKNLEEISKLFEPIYDELKQELSLHREEDKLTHAELVIRNHLWLVKEGLNKIITTLQRQ